MKKLLTLAMVLSALLLTAMPAPAAAPCDTTLNPGDDIQAAINNATAGDVICLEPGTYTPTQTIQVNKALTLTSEDPYATTKPVINGGGTLGTIIYIAADDVTLDSLEITDGTADLIKSESPAVSRVTVRNCIVHGSSGDEGVQLKYCTDCLIECCVAYDVRQDGFNMAYSSGGTIRNCEVYNSRSENAAIYVYDSYDMTVECNYIHDTQAANGVGFYYDYGDTHTIANNLIVHNRWWGGKHCYDEADGNAIWIYKPQVASAYLVSHNTLDDNTPANSCAQPGNAIYVKKSASGVVVNVDDNIVTNHNGYGIRTWSGAAVNYSYNDLWQNALGATDGNPVDDGGNIYEDPLYNSDYTLQPGSPCIGTASDGKDMGRLFDECGCAPPNEPPDCSGASPSLDTIWSPNHKFVAVDVLGVTDPDGDPVTITIDSIYQDEPVDSTGDGSFVPDGKGVGSTTAEVRAERDGSGNGRLYHIGFIADDSKGGTCSGTVMVSVPKSQGKKGAPVDDGALYDSTVP
jgi:parallel beta-helix repeat protein